MNYTTLTTEQKNNGIQLITINRPDKLNALNDSVLTELNHVFTEAKQDQAVKGLIITGEGKAFCAGADINRLAEIDAKEGVAFAKQGQQVFRYLETLGKPSIAAINGFAFGGGCELAMNATLRIAAEKAMFGQPEVKLGVIPGYGGTQRLARLVGKGRALELCLTGRFIKAEEALQWGLVSQVTTAEELLSTAETTLQTILNMGPMAIASVMQVIDAGYDMTLDDALHLEAIQFGLTCATEDKHIGVSAFLEKQEPEFKGN